MPLPIVGAAVMLFKSDPLKWILVAGVAATGAMLGWHLAFTDPGLRDRIRTAESARDAIEVQHQRLVAQAAFAEVEQSERFRAIEQHHAAEIEKLRKEKNDADLARASADARAHLAGSMRDAAEARYVTEQDGRAAADPASARRIDGETIAMLRELRRQTDGFAEEASRDADALRDQVIGLQGYIIRACSNRETSAPRPTD